MQIALFNYLNFELPDDCIEDCSHVGDCTEDVEHWQSKLNLNLDRDKMLKELKAYGAWDMQELNELSNDELECKLIWIASCDLKDKKE